MQWLCVLFAAVLLILPVFAADAPVSDDELYDQIRLRIAADREIGGGRIDVHVSAGAVELTGKVKTAKQKEKAEKIAKKVKGVKSVVNKIQVAPV